MTAQQSSPTRLILPLVIAFAVTISCGGREQTAGTSESPETPTAARERTPEPFAQPPTSPQRPSGTAQAQRVTRIVPKSGADTIELPDAFPADVPLHPDASPVRYVSSQKSGTMTVMVVDESPDAARDYYTSALENEGWTIDMDGASSDLLMLSASKRGRTLAVAIAEDDSATTITLIEGSD